MDEITVLAIETSCDETAVAVVQKNGPTITVLADIVASQVDIHAATGGVVPEVAAREHLQVIGPLIKQVMTAADAKPAALDAIAVTVGPGLMPALSVGVNAARILAYVWKKPLVPVHHLAGHVVSALLRRDPNNIQLYQVPDQTTFPALALIVSGGHTLLLKVTDFLTYEILGTTRDDAAGEAFDKVARLLHLPYPGGPAISKLAQEGDASAYAFTRPMLRSGDLDFSFSGLKTEVLYTVRDLSEQALQAEAANLAASFQQAVVESLVIKTVRAAEQLVPKVVLLAGGVAANELLRTSLAASLAAKNIPLQVAPLELCGDNAIMIGQVGVLAFAGGRATTWQHIDAAARLDIVTMANHQRRR